MSYIQLGPKNPLEQYPGPRNLIAGAALPAGNDNVQPRSAGPPAGFARTIRSGFW